MSDHLPSEQDESDPIKLLIALVLKGRRGKNDDKRAAKEARDRANLHRDTKGDSKPPKVTEDDVPFDLEAASDPDETPSGNTEGDESDA